MRGKFWGDSEPCKAPSCAGPSMAAGFCEVHYSRASQAAKRRGEPSPAQHPDPLSLLSKAKRGGCG